MHCLCHCRLAVRCFVSVPKYPQEATVFCIGDSNKYGVLLDSKPIKLPADTQEAHSESPSKSHSPLLGMRSKYLAHLAALEWKSSSFHSDLSHSRPLTWLLFRASSLSQNVQLKIRAAHDLLHFLPSDTLLYG